MSGIFITLITWINIRVILPLLIIAFLLCSPLLPVSHAQITLDGSMGTSGPLTGPGYNITSDLGQIRGSNLFHSFGKFNVLTGESATFSGPNSIANILSRVTGGNQSFIDGLLASTIPGANLYLLNPAGVLFGANASLNVSGSFHVSTADYLQLGDNVLFNTIPGPQDSLLTTAPVTAFGFLGDSPSGITVNGSFLEVPEGETLSVVGGGVEMENGYLYAPEGQVNMISVASKGEVSFENNVPVVDSFGNLGNIDITHSSSGRVEIDGNKIANLDTSGEGGGAIYIRGGSFVMDGAQVSADTYGDKNGRAVDIQLTDGFIGRNKSNITTNTRGLGDAGNFFIQAGNITLENTSDITTKAIAGSSGNAGDISIKAKDSINISGGGIISETFGIGSAGSIVLDVGNLNLGNLGLISTTAWINSPGKAGDITIKAKDDINISEGLITSGTWGTNDAGSIVLDVSNLNLDYQGLISTTTWVNSPGKAGDITINATGSVNILEKSQILSETWGAGDAGSIHLNVKNLTLTNGGYISTDAIFSSSGNAGDISIKATGSVNILREGQVGSETLRAGIASETWGKGSAGSIVLDVGNLNLDWGIISTTAWWDSLEKAGDITINATGSVNFSEGLLLSSNAGEGDGGNIHLNVGDLILTDSWISTSTQSVSGSKWQGGSISITATDFVTISGDSRIKSETWGAGNAGSIQLDVGSLTLTDGGFISTDAILSSSGNSGDIKIKVTDSITISGDSRIKSETWGAGNAGSIQLDVGNLTLTDEGYISTDAKSSSSGNAGDIKIKVTDSITISGDSRIKSETLRAGDAGSIQLDVGNLTLTDGGYISTNAGEGSLGNAGKITITATDSVNITGEESRIVSETLGEGDAGTIDLGTNNLTLSDFAVISSETVGAGDAGAIVLDVVNLTLDFGIITAKVNNFSSGKGGNITIRATDSVNITGKGVILSETFGAGDAGTIELNVGNLTLTDSGEIRTGAFKDISSNAGKITIAATDSVNITGEGLIESETLGAGDAGTIELNVGNLTMADSGKITTSSSGKGDAGSVTINATNSVLVKNSGRIETGTTVSGQGGSINLNVSDLIFNGGTLDASSSGTQDAGTIELNVGNLTLTNLGEISTSALEGSSGNAGKIKIEATDSVNISGESYISSNTDGTGNAGTIELNVGNLTLTDLGEISTSALDGSSGNAGDIKIAATDSVNMTGGSFVASSTSGEGNGGIVTIWTGDTFQSDNSAVLTSAEIAEGGNITITAGQNVLLRNETAISAESSGAGDSGNININSGNTYLSENSSVTTVSKQADGGNINITAQYMTHLINSKITSSVDGGTGTKGGNITMNQQYGILDNSTIRANAFEGEGGNIRITASVFLADPLSEVSASSAKGIDGNVDIRAPVTNISGNIVPLKSNFSSATSLLLKPCAVRMSDGKRSSLVIAGRDSLPIQPGDLLPSPLYVASMAEADAKVASLSEKTALSYGMNLFDDKGLLPLDVLDEDTGCSTCPE